MILFHNHVCIPLSYQEDKPELIVVAQEKVRESCLEVGREVFAWLSRKL
jgi:hypothetical protein